MRILSSFAVVAVMVLGLLLTVTRSEVSADPGPNAQISGGEIEARGHENEQEAEHVGGHENEQEVEDINDDHGAD